MVAQHLTKSFSHLWPIRNFCAWVFALMIQAPPDVTRMYGRWSECAFKSHGSRFVNTLSAGCSFDDEYSVCSVHKTHTSQIPVAEVIFDTRKYPVSQWANHRAVSADRILLPVWAEIKQQQLQPLFSWTENNRVWMKNLAIVLQFYCGNERRQTGLCSRWVNQHRNNATAHRRQAELASNHVHRKPNSLLLSYQFSSLQRRSVFTTKWLLSGLSAR